jgi:hypothetical protein
MDEMALVLGVAIVLPLTLVIYSLLDMRELPQWVTSSLFALLCLLISGAGLWVIWRWDEYRS